MAIGSRDRRMRRLAVALGLAVGAACAVAGPHAAAVVMGERTAAVPVLGWPGSAVPGETAVVAAAGADAASLVIRVADSGGDPRSGAAFDVYWFADDASTAQQLADDAPADEGSDGADLVIELTTTGVYCIAQVTTPPGYHGTDEAACLTIDLAGAGPVAATQVLDLSDGLSPWFNEDNLDLTLSQQPVQLEVDDSGQVIVAVTLEQGSGGSADSDDAADSPDAQPGTGARIAIGAAVAAVVLGAGAFAWTRRAKRGAGAADQADMAVPPGDQAGGAR